MENGRSRRVEHHRRVVLIRNPTARAVSFFVQKLTSAAFGHMKTVVPRLGSSALTLSIVDGLLALPVSRDPQARGKLRSLNILGILHKPNYQRFFRTTKYVVVIATR
jgi:hypothetical protein